MDTIYGSFITIVPIAVIISLNILIGRRLRHARNVALRLQRVCAEESRLRLEFTGILLIVSTTFIVLNVPCFVAWCSNYVMVLQRPSVGETPLFQLSDDPTEPDRTRGWLSITRTIFFCNYCVNFFIYSLSGAYFRRYLRRCITCGCAGDGQDDTTNGRGVETRLRRIGPSRTSGQNLQMIATTSAQVISTRM